MLDSFGQMKAITDEKLCTRWSIVVLSTALQITKRVGNVNLISFSVFSGAISRLTALNLLLENRGMRFWAMTRPS